ncbi:DUF4245 domain-containing protein [Streptomyces sp. NBC_01304]|uniref:DUF4245 domain-containing protein n=1 Tax=Streptomyces sp. NBC_01304 TaxID=2903818 RepID=UPI002E0F97D3|nr:DUF4245 domain-containing protein [Streptomyces sp. NBC_01304]
MAGMKGTKNVRNMLQSLAVVGVVVAAIYVFIPHDDTRTPPTAVDYRVELLQARRTAPYPVLAPEGLAKGDWVPTSRWYKDEKANAWHLGFHTTDGSQYVAVEQSTETPRKFIDRVSQSAEKTSKTEQIGGETWTRYEGDTYDALVREDKGATIVVTGSASFARLTEMAKALKA